MTLKFRDSPLSSISITDSAPGWQPRAKKLKSLCAKEIIPKPFPYSSSERVFPQKLGVCARHLSQEVDFSGACQQSQFLFVSFLAMFLRLLFHRDVLAHFLVSLLWGGHPGPRRVVSRSGLGSWDPCSIWGFCVVDQGCLGGWFVSLVPR